MLKSIFIVSQPAISSEAMVLLLIFSFLLGFPISLSITQFSLMGLSLLLALLAKTNILLKLTHTPIPDRLVAFLWAIGRFSMWFLITTTLCKAYEMLIQKFYNRQDVFNKRDYNVASETCQHLIKVIAWEYLYTFLPTEGIWFSEVYFCAYYYYSVIFNLCSNIGNSLGGKL